MMYMDAAAEHFAIDLAQKAGKLMRTNFSLGTKKTWKADNSPLTVTDVAINEMVIDAVKATYPNHAIIGEEDSFGDTAHAEWVWVCDPIDGTVPFSSGYPTFAFSLGLAHHGESVLGVIFDPFLDRMVVARKGNGARLNGEPTRVGDFASLNRTAVDIEAPGLLLDGGAIRTALHRAGCRGITFNSVVYGGILLACGELSGVIYTHQHPWDGCALDVIIKEAGGQVTNLRGEHNKYNENVEGFVASNGVLHDDLLAIIKSEYP